MKASDIMTFGAATVSGHAPLTQAARLMVDHRISALPVLDAEGKVQGIISDGDFFRNGQPYAGLTKLMTMDAAARAKELGTHTVAEVMTANPVTIDLDAPVEEAATLMEQHMVRRLPVTSEGRVVGLISRPDLLRMLLDSSWSPSRPS